MLIIDKVFYTTIKNNPTIFHKVNPTERHSITGFKSLVDTLLNQEYSCPFFIDLGNVSITIDISNLDLKSDAESAAGIISEALNKISTYSDYLESKSYQGKS